MRNYFSSKLKIFKFFLVLSTFFVVMIGFVNCSGFSSKSLSSIGSSSSLTSPDAPVISLTSHFASDLQGSSISESFNIVLTADSKLLSVTCQLNLEIPKDCSSKTITYDNLAIGDYTLTITATTTSGASSSIQKTYHKDPAVTSATIPAWLAGKPLNSWIRVPGTSGAGGSAVFAYSGMALKASSSEIIIAAAGGHSDSSDNRVVSIRLDQDSPAWITRMQPSAQVQIDVAHYADGKPSARHTYYSTQYVPQLDRVMLIGAEFTYGSAVSFSAVDGFNLSNNLWDPAGTWPAATAAFGKTINIANGDIWSASDYNVAKWSAITGTQTLTLTNAPFMAKQNAWDPARNQLISIGFGDGWGYGNFPTLNAYRIDSTGTTVTPITFNLSPGLTQFLADKPVSAAFEYDPDNDRFIYYGGNIDGGRIYVLNPNSSAAWDVSILSLASGTNNPPLSDPVGVNNRVRYVPQLKGFVYLHCGPYGSPDNLYLYFIRTSI